MLAESGTTPSIQDNGCHACERSISDLDQTNVLRVSGLYELPFGPQKQFLNQGPLGRLVGGWELGGTYQYDTGQPLGLTSPIQPASLNGATVSATSYEYAMRPTLVPGESISKKVINPKTGELSSFNPAAFAETGTYAFGNAPRNLSDVRFPAFQELDALLEKNTKINERMGFTVRFEALNALNTVVFGTPDVGVTDTNFGYNPHTQANVPRIAQISGRFTF